MRFSSAWRRSFVFVILLALAVAPLWAFSATLGVWGNADPRFPLGAFSSAATGGGNSTYTKTRVIGNYPTTVCQVGFKDEFNWCAGTSGWLSGSGAEMRANVIPYGWITGQSIHYVDGSNVSIQEQSSWVSDPPSPQEVCEEDLEYRWVSEQCVWWGNSPIIIDTSNNPNDRYRMTSVANGVLFDINADGLLDRIAWVANGQRVAFLAIDRDGNGAIDDGSELFGTATLPGVTNGFKALADIEAHNGDGTIDARDSVYSKLLLWHDRNGDGISAPGELSPASDELQAVGLGYSISKRVDRHGNHYLFAGWARQNAPGVSGKIKRRARFADLGDQAREYAIYDVFFAGQLGR